MEQTKKRDGYTAIGTRIKDAQAVVVRRIAARKGVSISGLLREHLNQLAMEELAAMAEDEAKS